MALPILVPGFELVARLWPENARRSAKHPAPKKVRKARLLPEPLMPSSMDSSSDMARRMILIKHWRAVSHLPPAGRPRSSTVGSSSGQQLDDRQLIEPPVNLLAICEWHLRRRLRQEWDALVRASRAQLLASVSRFERLNPVVIGNATMTAAAASWMLFGMYWCGTSHPAALFQKPLHPPTGLVRWLSTFHIDQQTSKAREIQSKLIVHLSITKGRCDQMVRQMMKRTGRVALLKELCDF